MRYNCVDLVLEVLIFCKNFPFFHLLYNAVDKLKSFSVGSLYLFFILQVNVRLHIRRFLPSST